MGRKSYNLLCVLISIAPFLLLAALYSKVASLPNIKIVGQNGMVVTKGEFSFLIILLSVLIYYASYVLSQRFNVLKVSGFGLRIVINTVFSILTGLLICVNMVKG